VEIHPLKLYLFNYVTACTFYVEDYRPNVSVVIYRDAWRNTV